jgi:hydroxymethylbilane synthase
VTRSAAGRETLRIATRGSAQARTQAEVVAGQLQGAHPGLEVTLVLVETTGDRRADVPLHEIGGQGVFVKEVQRAVLDGRADIAVHSAKDLTSQPTEGLVLASVPPRRDARDALIGATLDGLATGATVATGSVRRRAQLARVRPDLRFVELRGNIATRLEKVPPEGSIVMAVAALEVLGLTDRIAEVLDPVQFVPQVGQGAIAVECRDGDAATLRRCRAIEDTASRHDVEVERAFLAEIGSGCSLPVGASVLHGEQGRVLATFLAGDDGRSVSGTFPLDGRDDPDTARRAVASLRADLAGLSAG